MNRFNKRSSIFGIPQLLCLLLIATELLYFLQFRKVNLDEGWYLWASKLVYEGHLLYRDFTYTQTPLLPYVYGFWQQVAGETLMAGRLLTSLFSLATAVVGALVVQRRLQQRGVIDGSVGVITYLLLFATSFYALAYLSYTATYGLSTILCVGALYFALDADKHNSIRGDLLTVGLFGLAVSTRLSLLAGLPILAAYRIWRSPYKWQTVMRIGIVLGLGGLLLAGMTFVSGSQMVYDIFGFHTDRTPSMLRQFWRMVRTTQNSGLAYGTPLLIILVGGILAIYRTFQAARHFRFFVVLLRRNDYEIALLLSSLGIFLLHLWPRTTDAYYNTLLFPIWIILAALVVAKIHKTKLIIVVIILLNLILQVAAVRRNDLFQIPPINQLGKVDDAAQFLDRIDKTNNQLLTLNTHLALESGMRVPHGYEMSIFSYRPDWSNEQAAQFHVVNNQGLIADLRAGVDAVAVTDFDIERFYGDRQQIFDTLESNYRLAKTIKNFDPFYNNLYIYLPPQFVLLEPDNSLVVDFENKISLLGYDELQATYQPNDQVIVAAYWQAEETLELSFTVFIHLFDDAGTVLDGWDNPPCRTTCPTTSWRAGEILRDEYTLQLPDSIESGRYRLRVGMYHSDTGNNVMALTQGSFIEDGRLIILGEVVVE